MRTLLFRALAGVCLMAQLGRSGPPVAPENRYERMICVVPMVGTGTYDDPRRPMFTSAGSNSPLPTTGTPAQSLGFLDPAQIVAYSSVLSDDGQRAIVQFVARDRAAFRPLLQADASLVQVFERGKVSRSDLLVQLQKIKKDFTFESLTVGAR